MRKVVISLLAGAALASGTADAARMLKLRPNQTVAYGSTGCIAMRQQLGALGCVNKEDWKVFVSPSGIVVADDNGTIQFKQTLP